MVHMNEAFRDLAVHHGHVDTTYLALIPMPLQSSQAGLAVALVAVDGYLNGCSFDVGSFLLDLIREEVWFDGSVFMDDLKALIGEQLDAL